MYWYIINCIYTGKVWTQESLYKYVEHRPAERIVLNGTVVDIDWCQHQLIWYKINSCHFDSGDDYRTEVVKTSVTVNNISIHHYMYVHRDNHAQLSHALTLLIKKTISQRQHSAITSD